MYNLHVTREEYNSTVRTSQNVCYMHIGLGQKQTALSILSQKDSKCSENFRLILSIIIDKINYDRLLL
jgi:hypothetical protein